jgi:hypothetical protein
MRRFVPILLCFVLALSGLCAFNCFNQITHPDPHAACHGGTKGSQHSLMVVQSHPPVSSQQHSTAAQPYQTVAFAMPLVADIQPQRLIRPPVFRSSPHLTLRI